MNYSLGNMLGGAGALNADKLSLNLQFATDKSLTARKGPTPTFTRASTATFVGSNGLIQSAAVNTARFDHDPVTLACKGLLIEESRTNLVFPSATLTTQTCTVTAVAHTLSFYGTGTVVLSGAHVATVIGTGAYPTRTTLTFTPSAGSLTLTVTGTVTEAQLEAGSFPTSYIPTVASSVVRSADVCSISSIASFYGNGVGTILVGSQLSVISTLNGVCGFFTGGNQISISRGGSVSRALTNGASPTLTINSGTLASTLFVKAAFAFNTNDAAFANNGVLSGTSTSVAIPSVVTFLIGSNGFQTIQSGTISEIKYFRKRLSNAKIQALTT